LICEYEIDVDCNAGHPFPADVAVDGTMYGGDLIVLKTNAACTENAILWPKVHGNNPQYRIIRGALSPTGARVRTCGEELDEPLVIVGKTGERPDNRRSVTVGMFKRA
jgi:hypothetical protein